MTKYIFVTGGVVSGLGKGITAASLGRLLKARGLKVAAQKLDPYINVDPGTMSPYQHGEVYVTEDGAETDLDLGHYERFIDEDLNKYSNLTTAVSRGHPSGRAGGRARKRTLHPRDARAVSARQRGAQDQAHAALGQGAAGHGHFPGHHRAALR